MFSHQKRFAFFSSRKIGFFQFLSFTNLGQTAKQNPESDLVDLAYLGKVELSHRIPARRGRLVVLVNVYAHGSRVDT